MAAQKSELQKIWALREPRGPQIRPHFLATKVALIGPSRHGDWLCEGLTSKVKPWSAKRRRGSRKYVVRLYAFSFQCKICPWDNLICFHSSHFLTHRCIHNKSIYSYLLSGGRKKPWDKITYLRLKGENVVNVSPFVAFNWQLKVKRFRSCVYARKKSI